MNRWMASVLLIAALGCNNVNGICFRGSLGKELPVRLLPCDEPEIVRQLEDGHECVCRHPYGDDDLLITWVRQEPERGEITCWEITSSTVTRGGL